MSQGGGGGANQPQAYTLLFGKYAWLTWFSMFSSYMYMQLKQYNYGAADMIGTSWTMGELTRALMN